MDATGDDGGDVWGSARGATPATRWMSYCELADFPGTEESARRRAQQARWSCRSGNFGQARVGVPGDVTPDDARKAARDDAGDDGGDVTPTLMALAERAARAEGEAAALWKEGDRLRAWAEERLNAATRRLDEERSASAAKVMGLWTAGEAARVQAAETATEVTALRGQVKAERGRAELAREEAAAWVREAEAARDAARAELEEWGRGGPIARALRAFLKRPGRP